MVYFKKSKRGSESSIVCVRVRNACAYVNKEICFCCGDRGIMESGFSEMYLDWNTWLSHGVWDTTFRRNFLHVPAKILHLYSTSHSLLLWKCLWVKSDYFIMRKTKFEHHRAISIFNVVSIKSRMRNFTFIFCELDLPLAHKNIINK